MTGSRWSSPHWTAAVGALLIGALFVVGQLVAGEQALHDLEVSSGAAPASTVPPSVTVPSTTAAGGAPAPVSVAPSPRVDADAAVVSVTAERGTVVAVSTTVPAPVFTRGDCRWIEDGLRARGLAAGWVEFGVRIARRESQCCPNLRGGDVPAADCTVVDVERWNHRSDTGAFQLNGVHYRTDAGLFCPEFTCEQQTILDDPQLQLDLFVVLLTACGDLPWRPPDWGCAPVDPFEPPG